MINLGNDNEEEFKASSDDYPDQEANKELRQATKKNKIVRGKREQDLTEEISNKLNRKRTRTKKSKPSVDGGTEEPHTGKATEDSDLIGDSTEDKRSSTIEYTLSTNDNEKEFNASSDDYVIKEDQSAEDSGNSNNKNKRKARKKSDSTAGKKAECNDKKNDSEKAHAISEPEMIVKIATDVSKEFFNDQYESPYAALMINGRVEILCMNKKRFKSFLGGTFYEETETVPKPESITSAINVLKYKAEFKGGKRTLYERVANDGNDTILYDLTNPKWEVIKAIPSDWTIESNPPIVFRRHNNEQPQVYPEKKYRTGVFDEFMDLLNIKGDDNKLLMKCYIVTLFIPGIQKPILMLHGEQGAAKSTLQEIIKALVDPRAVATLSFPNKPEEMVQQLSHNYIAYYDNISQIREWISNILCRAVTGSGFSKRQLYTDDDIIYNYKRAIGFNGINLAATKADLLDRGLIISLDRLTEQQQRNISEIWKRFHEIKPKVLGYIFDVLVKVLDMNKNNPVKLGKLPRMAEFAINGETVSRCMGNKDGMFTDAFKNNRKLQATQILETSPVSMILNEFMEETIEDKKRGYDTIDIRKHMVLEETDKYVWSGPAAELLTQLSIRALNMGVSIKSKLWPGAPHILSRRLAEVRATLREIGIEIEFLKDVGINKTRQIKVSKVASPASPASQDGNRVQISNGMGDAIKGGDPSGVSVR